MSEIDETDKLIVSLLQQNGRMTAAHIAIKLSVGETTIRNRIRKLLNKGVIKCFTINPDYAKIGKPITAFIILDTDSGQPNNTGDQLRTEVSEFYRVGGEHEYIAKIRCQDLHELGEIIGRIKHIPHISQVITYISLQEYP